MSQAFSGDGWITGITEAMIKCHKGGFRLIFWFVQIKSNVLSL